MDSNSDIRLCNDRNTCIKATMPFLGTAILKLQGKYNSRLWGDLKNSTLRGH